MKIQQMFRGLRREVGLRDSRTSKISTLKKVRIVFLIVSCSFKCFHCKLLFICPECLDGLKEELIRI